MQDTQRVGEDSHALLLREIVKTEPTDMGARMPSSPATSLGDASSIQAYATCMQIPLCYSRSRCGPLCINPVIFKVEESKDSPSNNIAIMFQVTRLRSFIRMLQILDTSRLDPHLNLPLHHR